jgi:hypothetical protein
MASVVRRSHLLIPAEPVGLWAVEAPTLGYLPRRLEVRAAVRDLVGLVVTLRPWPTWGDTPNHIAVVSGGGSARW